jgi:GH24 family phage-related lysozyme (muramidase)
MLGNDEEIDADDIKAIAGQVRSMARLWPNNQLSDGDLNDRRHAEANLILQSIE